MTRFDVVGFGALNVDRLFRVNEIATADKESYVISCQETCGGSAANTTVGLARLRCKTGFIGKVSHDHEGNLLLKDFRNEGVDSAGVAVARNGLTGSVMGFIDGKGQRALYVNPGVNDTISLEEIDLELMLDTRILHLTSFVGDEVLETQRELVQDIKADVQISLDPGALYALRDLETLRPIIKKTTVFLPNARELKQLTGMTYCQGAELLLEYGVRIVAVKLGSRGCYVTNGRESHTIRPPPEIKVADTTGAGDAFNAGFLYGLLKGRDLEQCGQIGNFVASRCILKLGARTGLPCENELKKALFFKN